MVSYGDMTSSGERSGFAEQPQNTIADLGHIVAQLEGTTQDLEQVVTSNALPDSEVFSSQQAEHLAAVVERLGETVVRLTVAANAIVEQRMPDAEDTRLMDHILRFVSGQYFTPQQLKTHLIDQGLLERGTSFSWIEWRARIEARMAAQGERIKWLPGDGRTRILAKVVVPKPDEARPELEKSPAQETEKPHSSPPLPTAPSAPVAAVRAKGDAIEDVVPTPNAILAGTPEPPPTALEKKDGQLATSVAEPLAPPAPKAKERIKDDSDPAFTDVERRMAGAILRYLQEASPHDIQRGLRHRGVINEVKRAAQIPNKQEKDYHRIVKRLIKRGFVQQDLIPPGDRTQRKGKILRPRRTTEITLDGMLATLAKPYAESDKQDT